MAEASTDVNAWEVITAWLCLCSQKCVVFADNGNNLCVTAPRENGLCVLTCRDMGCQ